MLRRVLGPDADFLCGKTMAFLTEKQLQELDDNLDAIYTLHAVKIQVRTWFQKSRLDAQEETYQFFSTHFIGVVQRQAGADRVLSQGAGCQENSGDVSAASSPPKNQSSGYVLEYAW